MQKSEMNKNKLIIVLSNFERDDKRAISSDWDYSVVKCFLKLERLFTPKSATIYNVLEITS